MTPNELTIYFVADMVVANTDFPCGRYGFLLWLISSCCGRYGLWPKWSHLAGLPAVYSVYPYVTAMAYGEDDVLSCRTLMWPHCRCTWSTFIYRPRASYGYRTVSWRTERMMFCLPLRWEGGGKVRGINARRWVICEAAMCEAQRTTSAAGVVVGCEPLKRN